MFKVKPGARVMVEAVNDDVVAREATADAGCPAQNMVQ